MSALNNTDKNANNQKVIFLTVTCPSIKNEILLCKKYLGKLYVKNVFSDIANINRYKNAEIYLNKVLEYKLYQLLIKAKKFVKDNNLHKAFIYDNMVNIQVSETSDRIKIFNEKDLKDAISMQS